jgi:hypothetical protein
VEYLHIFLSLVSGQFHAPAGLPPVPEGEWVGRRAVLPVVEVEREFCALLGCYATSSGNPLPTFRDNVSVPSSRVLLGLLDS